MTDVVPVRLPYQRRERRDALPVVSTTTPLAQWGFTTPGSAALRHWEADEAIRLAYYSNVYVAACAKAIAEDIAGLTFRAGPDPDDPEDYNDSAPLVNLLGPPSTKSPDGPLPMISSKTWWEWTIVQLLITGAFMHEKVGFGTASPQLWPIPVTKITPIDSRTPGVWFDGFRFGGWGSYTRTLKPEQAFYYWRPSADDFRKPESVLQSARLDVSVAVMQDRYDYAFLKNDARPASIIVHEAFSQAAENDAFQAKFLTDHQGVDNAGKPIFVKTQEDGAPVKDAIAITTLGLSQRDAEFIQRYEMKIRAIIVAFGVPMSRLGDSSQRTFSNAGQEYFNYYRKLKTICRELQDAVNTHIAPQVGKEYGWFDTTPLDEAMEEAKIQAAGLTDLVKTRLVQINEGRAQLGLPAVPDGDRFLTDEELGLLQGAAAQIVVQQAAPPPPDPSLTPAPSGEAPSAQPEGEPQPGPAQNAPPNQRAFTHLETRDTPEDHRERRVAAYQKRARRVMQHERQMQSAVQEILDRQLTATLSRLTGKRGRQALRTGEIREPAATATVDEVFDTAFWVSETTKRVRPIFEGIFGDAASTILEELNSQDIFDVQDPTAYHLIEKRANQLAGNITDTTYQAIKEALAEGASEGEAIPKLAARISNLFEQTYKNRAVTVARTEVLSAYNGSAMATGMALPDDVVSGFEWLSTPGARTRPAHNAADGQVIPSGAKFSVGGTEMAYPGDPSAPPGLVVNCRCTLLVLTPAEYQARVGEVNGGFTTLTRGSHTFHSHEVAMDGLLSRAVRNPPPEDGWEPPPFSHELRGDKASHSFHGNQHTGGKGGASTAEVDAATSFKEGRAAFRKSEAVTHDPKGGVDTSTNKAHDSYMGDGSAAINESMRNGKPSRAARDLEEFHRTHGVQLEQPITVDRGVVGDHAAALRNLPEGGTVEYKSFISTSFTQAGGDKFTPVTQGDAVMRVTLPKGTRVLNGTATETELILAPGKLRMVGKSEAKVKKPLVGEKTVTVLHMEYEG